ncbi:MAG: Spy/CpxP family protein refolding chaperone [bacterium]
MKTKIVIIILVISLGINVGFVASYVYQQLTVKRFEERDIAKRSWRRGGLRRKLNLGENQLKAIEAMQEKASLKMQAVRETLKIKREDLTGLLKKPQLDKSRLQTLIKEIANLQAEIELVLSENIWQVKEVLTPEQQQQFFKLFNGRLKSRKMLGFPSKHLNQKHKSGKEYKKWK